MTMDATQVEALFTRADGSFLCARWGRPIVPVVFGVQDATLDVVKSAIEAVVVLANHKMAETDPELGANLMVFFFRDWNELLDVPRLGEMIPDLAPLVARLSGEKASQYRAFRFDDDGAIQAAFVFLCMDGALADMPAGTVALGEAVQTILLWSESAFAEKSPLGIVDDVAVLRPEIANVIRAAYDPVLPVATNDPIHALRLAARLEVHS